MELATLSRSVMDIPDAPGNVVENLLRFRGQAGALRPWKGRDGKSYVSVRRRDGTRANVVVNAPTALPYDAYKYFDDLILPQFKKPLVVWNALQAEGLRKNIPNGLAYTAIQHQKSYRYQEANLSMSPLRQTVRSRPAIEPALIPLPLWHADGSFDFREILQARRANWDLDTQQLEEGARVIGEGVEDLVTGVYGSYTYAGGTIYGMTNHPNRLTTTFTTPTGAWTPDVTYEEILAGIKTMKDNNFNGPYGVFFSNDWFVPLTVDYSAAYKGDTLMTKLTPLPDVNWVRLLPRVTGYVILIVNLDSRTIQAVTGLELQTIRWDTFGGMQINFKLMCIKIPRVMDSAEASPKVGILHATA
jgi:uncharacterized linocin/CFP29 family protein